MQAHTVRVSSFAERTSSTGSTERRSWTTAFPSPSATLGFASFHQLWIEVFANKEGYPAPGTPLRSNNYFSLLGGVSPFNRRYSASVAYCSLSCDTVPHTNPTRDRFPCPA